MACTGHVNAKVISVEATDTVKTLYSQNSNCYSRNVDGMGAGVEDVMCGPDWGQVWGIYSPACCGVPVQSPGKTNQKRNLLHTWRDH